MSNPEPSISRDWATWLVGVRCWLFAAALLATALCWGPAGRLPSDQSVEALFAKNDSRIVAFLKSQAVFGGDELAFFCYTDPNLNSKAGMSRLRDLSQELGEVPGIRTESVQDLATSLDQARLPFVNIPPDKFRELTHRVLIGDDGITTAIVLRFAPLNADHVATGEKRAEVVLATVPRLQTVRQVREVGANFAKRTGLEPYLVGEPVQELDALEYTELDDEWLWIYSALLLQLILLLYFLNLRWMLVPAAVAFVALVWTRAISHSYGMRLGMVSSMLTPVLMIMGVALVIPIAVRFRERRQSAGPRKALEATLRELGHTLLVASLVTAIGCAALMTSEVYSLAEFGWMTAIGALLVVPAMVCVLPFGILAGSRNAALRPAPAVDSIERILRGTLRVVEGAPIAVTVVTLGLVGFAVAGCVRVSIETDFIKNFRPSSPIAIGLDYVERHFGGSATWEVNFPTPDEITEEFLQSVEKLAVELRSLEVNGRPALTKVICLADGEAIVPRTFFTAELSRRLWLLDKLQAEYVSTLYNADEKRMRLILRSLERQSSPVKLEIMRRTTEIARKHFPEAEATGIFAVLTLLIENLLRDQWLSFGLAAAGIFLLVGCVYRKITFGLICLVPNACSAILVLGVMGWIGYPVNIASAMVASLSLGLMVASSIHYLSRYQQARWRGLEVRDALHEAHRESGRVVFLANLTVSIGFLVLTNSHFIPVIYFGIMASVVMFGGLIGNLCLLPLLLGWVEGGKRTPIAASLNS